MKKFDDFSYEKGTFELLNYKKLLNEFDKYENENVLINENDFDMQFNKTLKLIVEMVKRKNSSIRIELNSKIKFTEIGKYEIW